MTTAVSATGAGAVPGRRIAIEVALVWLAAIAVHVVLGWINLTSPSNPFGDVRNVYPGWMAEREAGVVPGIDGPFVYPVVALVPLMAADAVAHLLGGHDAYPLAWLFVVGAADAALLAVLTLVRPRGATAPARRRAAWWWVLFLAFLGPIAIGRIDSFTVPLAVGGLLAAARWPFVSGALLTLGAWIKVWPAAAYFAVLTIAGRRAGAVLLGAVVVCAAVVLPVIGAGGGAHVLSFLTEQTDRGLQIESVLAAGPMLAAAFGAPGYDLAFSTEIITFQITGPGTELLGRLGTPLMVVCVVAIVALGWRARRLGADHASVLPPLAFGLVLALIVTNKVGSPQFATWIGAVVVFGLVVDARRFAGPAVVALVSAGLTQIVYPWMYDGVTSAWAPMVIVLELRNLISVGLLVWCVVELLRTAREARERSLAVT